MGGKWLQLRGIEVVSGRQRARAPTGSLGCCAACRQVCTLCFLRGPVPTQDKLPITIRKRAEGVVRVSAGGSRTRRRSHRRPKGAWYSIVCASGLRRPPRFTMFVLSLL